MPRTKPHTLELPKLSEAAASSAPASDLALSGLVHDLNNVFQTLMEAADLISDDPRWADVSAAMLRSIERGKGISASLLTMNQPQATLDGVLQNAVAFVLDSIHFGQGPEIRFRYDVESRINLRRSYAWERVFINLFTNAVRAMPGGGTITVRARRADHRIEISVSDEGSGIPAALLPRIFDPHVSERANGGLGLHIVKTIVCEHHGEVSAQNRPDKGAEFVITIPAERGLARSAKA
ncbi:MAG: sensor histidine kinase [Bryobacteraceae bacterium]